MRVKFGCKQMSFSNLKFILFTFILPLIAISALFKKIYGYTLFQVVYGWVANFRALDPLIGLVIMSVIFTPFLLFPVGGFFNALYLQVVGEKQEMLYVGAAEYGGMYIDLKSQSEPPVGGNKVSASDSASKLYHKYMMVRDPLDRHWAGELSASMGFGGMLARFLFALGGGLVVLLIMIHYAEYLYAFLNHITVSQDDLRFFRFIERYGISLKLYWVVLLLIFPAAIATHLLSVKYTGSKYSTQPSELQPGGEFFAVPLSTVRVRKKEYTDIDREDWKWVDTPFYDIYFVSDKGFPYKIYGSVRIDSREHTDVVEKVEQTNKNQERLRHKIRVNDEMYFRFIGSEQL